MGFVGPEKPGLLTDLGVELTDRGNVARNADFETSVPGCSWPAIWAVDSR